VALMPCSAKKFECNRPEMWSSGYKDVDYGLTTRELAKMISEAGIHLPSMPGSDFDDPFGTATGSGVIFGATGGVMEAALRTVLELVTGQRVENLYQHANIVPVRGFEGVKYAEIPIKDVGPIPALLAPGGRACIIAYHSLEDRAVKQAFRALAHRGRAEEPAAFTLLAKKPGRPGEEELRRNPRARSARLRAIARAA